RRSPPRPRRRRRAPHGVLVARMTPLLEARGVVKHFPVRGSLFGGSQKVVRAVDDVSFVIEPGATLGLVGESGCGKTTTAKLVLLLERPTAGEIRFDGESLATLDAEGLRRYRHSVQAVFQDPYAPLSPRMRVGSIITEPLVTNERLSAAELATRLRKVLDLVGLPARAGQPARPCTKAPFAAPRPAHPDESRDDIVLAGDVPSPLDPPSGCRFHTRCPQVMMPRCSTDEPQLACVDARDVACHLYDRV